MFKKYFKEKHEKTPLKSKYFFNFFHLINIELRRIGTEDEVLEI